MYKTIIHTLGTWPAELFVEFSSSFMQGANLCSEVVLLTDGNLEVPLYMH